MECMYTKFHASVSDRSSSSAVLCLVVDVIGREASRKGMYACSHACTRLLSTI
eukprot:m.36080 g.36080  ORF g.36080 m.36080 type:complete len:53 (-) comp6644_c0_seq2:1496-1654(-)